MTRLTNLALAAVTSFGLAVTPISATAAPDGEDYAKILGGLALLGLIANSAKDNDRSTQQTQRLRSRDTYDRSIYRDRRVIDAEPYRPGGVARNRVEQRFFKGEALPERCVRILRTSRGDRLVYGRHCLNRHYRHASRLPQECERQFRTDRGVRTFYGSRCLRRDGWKVARR